MVSKETLLDVLPMRDQVVLTNDRQNTDDIRAEILAGHRHYAKDYDLIYHYFNTGNIVDTSRGIFDFLKANVPYTKESGKYQTIKSPAVILDFNQGDNSIDRVDCKNYASFIAGVLDAIKRNDGGSWDWCYRFASYDENDKEPGHVFVVVKMPDKGELWIDPVFSYFNLGSMHAWELDERPAIGGLYRIGSIPQNNAVTPVAQAVQVDGNAAFVAFLEMLQKNMFSRTPNGKSLIKTLMLACPDVTNGPVRNWFISRGYDFNQVQTFLNS